MTRAWQWTTLAIVAAVAPARAEVSEWRSVSQPLFLGGFEIVDSPYLVRIWGYPQEVEMTTWENLLYVEGEWRDRNAASTFGLEVRLGIDDARGPRRTNADLWGLGMRGDTLAVRLDTENAEVPLGMPAEYLGQVVALTIECIRRNALRYRNPKPRWLDLRVTGRPEFAGLSGVTLVEGSSE